MTTPPLPAICTDTYLTDRDRESIREAMKAHAEAVAAVRVREALEEAQRLIVVVHRGADNWNNLTECDCGWVEHFDGPSHADHLALVLAEASDLRARAAQVGEDGDRG
jgi:hypothetical protein